MNLYLWHGQINGERYSIYALANDLASAKVIAIAKAPVSAGADVRRIIEGSSPALYEESDSFIMKSAAQLT